MVVPHTLYFWMPLKQRGPTVGPRTNLFDPRIITVISVITIGLPCVPKIPDMSGNNTVVQKYPQNEGDDFFFVEHLYLV